MELILSMYEETTFHRKCLPFSRSSMIYVCSPQLLTHVKRFCGLLYAQFLYTFLQNITKKEFFLPLFHQDVYLSYKINILTGKKSQQEKNLQNLEQ